MPHGKQNSKNAGASAKMKKFPRIADYLQVRHPKVYEIIDDLAMHGSLSPRRGGGITFLIPNSALVAKIVKLIESDEPEKATDIVSSLILMDFLPSTKEFAARKDDIPTLLGKKLVIKTVGSSKVDIDNGSLTLDESFKPFTRSGAAQRGNMAVWKLDGEVEYEKAPRSEGKYGSTKDKSKKGSSGGSKGGYYGAAEEGEIDSFVQDVVNAECKSIRDQQPGVKRKSPMLRAVVNQLNLWKDNDPEKYNKARAILSLHPIISFFLIFKNRLYFPAADLNVVTTEYPGDDIVGDFRKIVDDKSGSAAMFSNRKAVRDAVQQLKARSHINLKAPEMIKKVYTEVDESNKIGSVSDVYPAGAIAAFRAHPGLHMLIDEFRHFLYSSIEELNRTRSPRDQLCAFRDLITNVNCFRSLLHPDKSVMDKVDPVDKSKSVTQIQEPFWDDFALYIPCTKFDDSSKYAYTGGDDDEEEGEGDGENKEEYLSKCLDELEESSGQDRIKYEERLTSMLKSWMDANDGALPGGLKAGKKDDE